MSVRSIVAVWTLALVAAAAAAVSVLTSDHITGEVPTIALAAPTGLAFIASGIVARTRRPENGTGVLLILVGFAWFLAALPTAEQPILFTAGLALNGLFIGFLAHLLLAFPTGRLSSRVERVIAVAMYFVVTVPPFAMLLFDEGEISSNACERGTCPENLLATIPAQNVAIVLALVYGIGAGLLSITVAVLLLQRWRRASPALRSALKPIVLTAGVLIALFAAQIVASVISEPVARAMNWALLVAMLALPLAFLYGLLRPRLTASSRRLAAELAEQTRPEEVEAVLRRALRDPTLELGYAGSEGYVGVDGQPLRLAGLRSGRAVTPIGDGIIVHDASLSDQPELDEAVDAARIALERGLSLRSLEASERRAEAIVDAIPDDMYRIRRDGTILDLRIVDPSRLREQVDTLIGRNIRDVSPPELVDTFLTQITLASEDPSRGVVRIEYDHPTYNEPGRPRRLEGRAVCSGDDEVVVIVRDITDIKLKEEALRTLAEEQAALSRVAVAVASGERPEHLFNVVTEEAGRLFGARWASTVRFEETDEAVVVVGEWHAGDDFELKLGSRFALAGGAITQVKRTQRPARIDYTLEPDERMRHMVAAPILVSGRLWGATTISTPGPDTFPRDAEERLGNFAHLVGVAIANAEAHEQLSASRARIVRAGDEERRRLERNLHDGAQQRLVALSLSLRLTQARMEADPSGAKQMLEAAADELTLALEELRELARGIHPAILTNSGLPAALEALAARAPVPVELQSVCHDRLPPSVEAAAYYVVAESLTNVAKYAEANAAQVSVTRRDGVAVVVVEDDGVGGADATQGSGLRGLADRVEALEGRFEIESAPGRGTVVRAEIPIG